jgi:hypothetical protein
VAGGIVLGGVVADRELLHLDSRDATAYHANVAAVGDTVPVHVANWVSTDTPIPQAAAALLRPNFTLSRRYTNLTTGMTGNLLIVQCRDARDLIGHYPPVCYVAHGWTLVSKECVDWPLENLSLHGTMYLFSSSHLGAKSSMKVFDVMVLPNGQTAPDMDGVYRIARDRRQRFFGAAQIQVITDSEMPNEARTAVTELILGACKPVINAIGTGVTP